MTAYMDASWLEKLGAEFKKSYMLDLEAYLYQEYADGVEVYPPPDQTFHALCHVPFEKVRVVIMGQDPYHGPKQAHGLSFSVPKGVALPPSLVNIFKELSSDLAVPMPSHGCLE